MKIRIIKRVPGQRWKVDATPIVNNQLGKKLIEKGFAEEFKELEPVKVVKIAPKTRKKTTKPTEEKQEK